VYLSPDHRKEKNKITRISRSTKRERKAESDRNEDKDEEERPKK